MILDAQVHVWKAERLEGKPHLERPFGYPDLVEEMQRAGVDGAILIPPGWEGDRSDYALEAAGAHPKKFGVMGRIAVKDTANAHLLKGWKARRGMLGVRVSFQKPDRQAWLADGTADWLWPAAEANDIPVMVFAPGQYAKLRSVATSHPKLRLIIDHMALAREQDAQAAAAIERLAELADCPNLYVKTTSVPLYSSEPYPYANLHDALRRLIKEFRPQRCFWGTDLTRIKSLATYRRCVTLFTEELAFLSASDLEWIMGRGLATCLNWSAFA
ncbi:MAG TPA: amidohydrolase family protein [Xanthobacteraceae bacterium]|nr:amidohydrolase family protein [Xanthobacteraceae bacterium]